MSQQVRDNALLDALETLTQEPYSGNVWRTVAKGHSPTDCWRSGGRWDDRTFDVLYTSESRDAAIEERRFHLYMGQPIPPSRVQYELYELDVQLKRVISFDDLEALKKIGLNVQGYGQAAYSDRSTEYPSSQAIAESCFFLGADGIVVPSARHQSNNIIVFCEQDTNPGVSTITNHGTIAW